MNKASLKKLNNSLSGFIYTVSSEELLMYDNETGKISVAGKPLSPSESAQIINEIAVLKNGLFWRYLVKDVVYTNNKILNEKANSMDDIIFHRAVKYTLQVVTKILEAWDKQLKQK